MVNIQQLKSLKEQHECFIASFEAGLEEAGLSDLDNISGKLAYKNAKEVLPHLIFLITMIESYEQKASIR